MDSKVRVKVDQNGESIGEDFTAPLPVIDTAAEMVNKDIQPLANGGTNVPTVSFSHTVTARRSVCTLPQNPEVWLKRMATLAGGTSQSALLGHAGLALSDLPGQLRRSWGTNLSQHASNTLTDALTGGSRVRFKESDRRNECGL